MDTAENPVLNDKYIGDAWHKRTPKDHYFKLPLSLLF
jgi:hypothetical protein